MSPGTQRKLLRRIAELKRVCSETYQVVGVLAGEAGRFNDDDVQQVLDNLSRMRVMHEDVLPFAPKEPIE